MNRRSLVLILTIGSASLIQPVARAALRTWNGAGADTTWTNAANWGGTAPIAGDDLLFPPAVPQLVNNNTFPNGTTFNSLIFSGGGYSIGGSSIALNAGILATNGVNNFIVNTLILNSNQTFTFNIGSANFTLTGAIVTNGKNLTFNVGSSSQAQVQAIISGTGGLIKAGAGSALFYASNTFSGTVQILQGNLSIYEGHALGDTNGNTTISSGTTLTLANPITVAEPLVLAGMLSCATGSKTLTGPMTLTATDAVIRTISGAPVTINAVISGTGGFTKDFADTLTLNSNNTYTWTTTIGGGALRVNGLQPASPIVLSQGSLAGTGTVGTVTCTNSSITSIIPGIGGPGILSCSNVTLNSTTTLGVELNGATQGSGYNQLNASGTVALSNAALSVSLGFTPAVGDSFVIIKNDGADSVNGTFSGLTNGAVLPAGGHAFQINYAGSSGNDVVLTRISPPTYFISIVAETNGPMAIQATGGLAGFSYTIFATTNLGGIIQWSNLGMVTATPSGIVAFIDSQAQLFPMRFYRLLSP